MNLEAVMPTSAWWALVITIAVLAAIIEAHTNDYGEGEVELRFGRWFQIQLGLWGVSLVCAPLMAGALQ